jgi:hypothetical protein
VGSPFPARIHTPTFDFFERRFFFCFFTQGNEVHTLALVVHLVTGVYSRLPLVAARAFVERKARAKKGKKTEKSEKRKNSLGPNEVKSLQRFKKWARGVRARV